MRYRVLFIVLNFLAVNIYGQFDFVGNDAYKKKKTTVDSIFQLNETYDFEFRLYSSGVFPPHHSIFVLTVKQNVFLARCFKMEKMDSLSYDWVELNIPNKNLERLWTSIHDNHVFDLPPFQKILDENQNIILGKDGISYTVEYSNNNKINGASWYRCPKSIARVHPAIKPIVSMAEIIRLVYNFIGKDWKPC